MENNEYKCVKCDGIFEKGQTDEEAKKEYEGSDYYVPDDEAELVCDDCYKEFIKFMKT